MDYITSEQLMEQSEKVYRELTNWLLERNEWCLCDVNGDKIWTLYNKNCIPLLQMHQLIEFIESKGYRVLMSYIAWTAMESQKCIVQYSECFDGELSKIEALWKIVCRIIKEN